jgi:hypothetical protein
VIQTRQLAKVYALKEESGTYTRGVPRGVVSAIKMQKGVAWVRKYMVGVLLGW